LGFVAAQVLGRARPEISTAAARQRVEEIEACHPQRTGWVDAAAEASELSGALVAGGRAYFLTGDADQARRWLLRGLEAAASDVVERLSAMSALSLVEAWCGNIEQADAWVHGALQTAREAGLLAQPSLADAYLASVLTSLDRGEPTLYRASDHTQGEVAQSSSGAVRTLAPTALFERATELLASGNAERARNIVSAWDQLVPAPEALSVVQHHILSAWFAVIDDAPSEATRLLTQAVKIAEVYGFVDVFIRCGPVILDWLSTVPGPQAAFSNVIRVRAQRSTTARGRDLPDPLTERELEILTYLPTRFTNVELASRCFVSVNTIKTHMAHIYRKLEATDRDTAISRAREFGLL
jgi:LuxR family maltose regulon positive regulatory protein